MRLIAGASQRHAHGGCGGVVRTAATAASIAVVCGLMTARPVHATRRNRRSVTPGGLEAVVMREIDLQGRMLQEITDEGDDVLTTQEEEELLPPPPLCDVAIIGGGLSGLYAGWRILTAQNFSETLNEALFPFEPTVCVFESTNRLGGRLVSVMPPEDIVMERSMFKAEFGDMHFPAKTEHVTSFVAKQFNTDVKLSPVSDPDNLYVLRREHTRDANLVDKVMESYELNWLEKGKHPYEIMRSAIELILPGAYDLEDSEWYETKMMANFTGEPLYMQGLWNVLSRVMSSEAYEMCKSYYGMDNILSNQNAAEGLHNLVKYYSNETEYVTPTMGMESLVTDLDQEFRRVGGMVYLNHRLTSFNAVNYTDVSPIEGVTVTFDDNVTMYELNFDGPNSTSLLARTVILALPQKSLGMIEQDNGFFDDPEVQMNMKAVDPVPYSKLFVCYEFPWWKQAGVKMGRSVTDTQLRQTYYYDDNCILATYSDGNSHTFWDVMDEYSSMDEPLNFESDDPRDRWQELSTSELMVEHAQRQLRKLHNLEYIPDPTSAAYMSWSRAPYGGGGHTWKVGVKPWEVQDFMLKPLEDWNVHVIGEAYSKNQRMIEGDLETAEAALQRYFFSPGQRNVWEDVGMSIRGDADGARIGAKMSTSSDGRTVAVVSENGPTQTSRTYLAGLGLHGRVQVYKFFGTADAGLWDYVGWSQPPMEMVDEGDMADSGDAEIFVALSGDGKRLAVAVLKTGDMNTTDGGGDDFGGDAPQDPDVLLPPPEIFPPDFPGIFTPPPDVVTLPPPDNDDVVDENNSTVLDENNSTVLDENNATAEEEPTRRRYLQDVETTQVGSAKMGHIQVFQFNGAGNWSAVGQVINGTMADDMFGMALALNEDGTRLIVGAPGYDDNTGRVEVYGLNRLDRWQRVDGAMDGNTEGGQFGYSVATSRSGNVIAVGAPFTSLDDGDQSNDGVVRVFSQLTGEWEQIGEDIEGEKGSEAGSSVALSDNGEFVAFGAPAIDEGRGSAAVFRFESGNWTQDGMSLYGEENGDRFGESVDLNDDAAVLAVGAPDGMVDNSKTGYVRVYDFNEEDGNWTMLGSEIMGSMEGDRMGAQVALSNDGAGVLVGAPSGDDLDSRGSINAFVFVPPPPPEVEETGENMNNSTNTTDMDTGGDTDMGTGGDDTDGEGGDEELPVTSPAMTEPPMGDNMTNITDIGMVTESPGTGDVANETEPGTDDGGDDETGGEGVDALEVRMTYDGEGWVGFGITEESTEDAQMPDSEAVIGLPAEGDEADVSKYFLASRRRNGVSIATEQTLLNSTITQDGGQTVLHFVKILEEPDEIAIKTDGPQAFLWAVGKDNELARHDKRGTFVLVLSECDDNPDDCEGEDGFENTRALGEDGDLKFEYRRVKV